jgi:4-hydroxy-tetrahydrodipicolinate reductase
MTKRIIGVVGASGRSGRFVLETLRANPEFSLGAALVSTGSRMLGADTGVDGVCFSTDFSLLARCHGVIDFSTAEVGRSVAALCVENRTPLLVAATGHSPEQRAAIEGVGIVAPVCIASNTSVGAAVLSLTAEYAKGLLGESFDIEVMEIHHRMKRDAPSGTAKSVVEYLVGEDDEVVYGRPGLRAAGEVGVVSLRGGDVPGDHTVYFLGHGERLELKHSVNDRRVFGQGAVTLLGKLIGRTPGVYTVRELLLG